MLTLPSGQIITLAAVPFGPPADLGKARLRRHLLASATEVQDLYPLLDVVHFVPREENCTTSEVGDLFSVPPQDSGLEPQIMRLSFLDFDDALDAPSKEAFDAWISSDAVRVWVTDQLHAIILQRYRNPQRQLYRPAPKPTTDLPVLSPADIAISSASLFPADAESWLAYASDSGVLRLRPKILSWGAGVWGTLALGNPPSAHDIDAWEASKRAGVWDYYEFLCFMTIPPSALKSATLEICFGASTFFDRPGESIASIPLADSFRQILETTWLDNQEFFCAAWQNILEILDSRYGLASLAEQVWTSSGQKFSAADPDQ